MEASEILPLLGDLESDRVERTASSAKTDKFGEAICAFANDLPNHGKPGYLIVGATDAGQVTGMEITDQLLEVLGAARRRRRTRGSSPSAGPLTSRGPGIRAPARTPRSTTSRSISSCSPTGAAP